MFNHFRGFLEGVGRSAEWEWNVLKISVLRTALVDLVLDHGVVVACIDVIDLEVLNLVLQALVVELLLRDISLRFRVLEELVPADLLD